MAIYFPQLRRLPGVAGLDTYWPDHPLQFVGAGFRQRLLGCLYLT